MYFFGIFFSLLLIFSLNAQSVQNIKHSVFVSKLKAFSVQVSKVEVERKKNGPINFFGGIIKKQIP